MISAATAWETTAESFAKESLIRYGWLREGLYERFEDGKLFVRFPASAKENSESFWMEKGLKDIESALTRALSRSVRLVLEWDESLVEQLEPVLEVNPAREEPAGAPAPEPAPPVDPMEDFKNDPFIKKALEVFKSTLQTSPA